MASRRKLPRRLAHTRPKKAARNMCPILPSDPLQRYTIDLTVITCFSIHYNGGSVLRLSLLPCNRTPQPLTHRPNVIS